MENPENLKIQNAKQKPAILYGLHFCPGVAEYREADKPPYRIFLNEQTLRDMDQSFPGCPIYVQHVDEVNLATIQQDADGYVTESFYNAADGKHWVKMVIVSDRGHQAVQNGWKLSNAYTAESFGPGGFWNGVEYQREITKGKFEHLAIVNDPRYAESIILTPAQFKQYNEDLRMNLQRVANSSNIVKETSFDSKVTMKQKIFSLFKKTEVETKDFEDALVSLPNGKDITVKDLIANAVQNAEESKEEKIEKHAEHKASEDKDGMKESEEEHEKHGDKPEEKGAAPQMANMDHHVMVGNESHPLHHIMKNYHEMRNMYDALAAHHAEKMKNLAHSELDGGECDADAAQKADLTKRNADEDGGEQEAVKQLEESDKTKRNSIQNFEKLADAESRSREEVIMNIDQLSQLQRGQNRYGSKGMR